MEKLPYTINMGPKANHIRLSKREAMKMTQPEEKKRP